MTDPTDVVPAPGRNLVIPSDNEYAVMTYDELFQMETFRISGFTLVSKDELLGVPHVITKVTYWKPLAEQLGMVSCEATVASIPILERAIERGWIPHVTNISQLKLEPNERVVYNDGGTGIRRQITQLLNQVGVINVGREDVEDGSRFDVAWPEWEEFSEYRRQSAEVGNVPCCSRVGDRPFLLNVVRGLSVSEYSNDYASDAKTYYLR